MHSALKKYIIKYFELLNIELLHKNENFSLYIAFRCVNSIRDAIDVKLLLLTI
jgi:hypothetical protein